MVDLVFDGTVPGCPSVCVDIFMLKELSADQQIIPLSEAEKSSSIFGYGAKSVLAHHSKAVGSFSANLCFEVNCDTGEVAEWD